MTQRSDNFPSKTILITIDLEDWFQVENLRPVFPISTWDSQELRIKQNTHTLLDLFDRHNIQATFFVLGWLAKRHPSLVRDIQNQGHEIASHGHNHQLCSELSLTELRNDLIESKAILENMTGQQIRGYRAPNFSLSEELITIIAELGFKYDSSYNNFSLNKRYGKPSGLFNPSANGYLTTRNGFVELPLSNLNFAGKAIPWSGGGYFRFWPSPVFHSGIKHILKKTGYYVFYCHPWEIDPEQPRISSIGALSRFRHYLNLDKTLDRLDRLFTAFKDCNFMTCSNYLGLQG